MITQHEVKIFAKCNNPDGLERDINDWLRDNDIAIHSINVSQSGRMDQHTIVIIHYEAPTENME